GVPKLREQRGRKRRQRFRTRCRGRRTGRCLRRLTAAIPNAQLALNAVEDLTRPVRLTHEIIHSRRQDVASLAGKYRRGDCCDPYVFPTVECSNVGKTYGSQQSPRRYLPASEATSWRREWMISCVSRTGRVRSSTALSASWAFGIAAVKRRRHRPVRRPRQRVRKRWRRFRPRCSRSFGTP